MTSSNHGMFFLAQQLPIIKSLSDDTKTVDSQFVVEILYENIPLTDKMLSIVPQLSKCLKFEAVRGIIHWLNDLNLNKEI